ncbi:hypothetical protein HAX54_019129 [Datura stramonium]|uniref:Uncharacterized protein n=1 Tax=Datura stramonium TaxID=4076 RepID=A0ABS8UQJ8_DATST|nr:hypothetical protein [Datura stramonium]
MTSFSSAGGEVMNFIISDKCGTSRTCFGVDPEVPKSRAVTLCPEVFKDARSLYQDQAPRYHGAVTKKSPKKEASPPRLSPSWITL